MHLKFMKTTIEELFVKKKHKAKIDALKERDHCS